MAEYNQLKSQYDELCDSQEQVIGSLRLAEASRDASQKELSSLKAKLTSDQDEFEVLKKDLAQKSVNIVELEVGCTLELHGVIFQCIT